MYERLLVPLDGSPGAEAVLPHARSLASRLACELILLRVDAPIPNLPEGRYPPAIRNAATEYLQRIAEPMLVRHLRVRMLAEYGDPAEVILSSAAELRVDAIVVAATPRRWSWLRPSVLHRVLRRACVPVLVVRSG